MEVNRILSGFRLNQFFSKKPRYYKKLSYMKSLFNHIGIKDISFRDHS